MVLISVDTLRADRLGAYGYAERVVSPRMDALGADGILFERALAASPWTTPSHMSLLTSLHPSEHGAVMSFGELVREVGTQSVFGALPDERQTLAEALAARGYATAGFFGAPTLDASIGFDQGFDVYRQSMEKVSEPAFEEMLEWVEARSERPFFLFWHTFEVHAPYLDTRFLADALPPDRAAKLEAAIGELGAASGGRVRTDDMRRRLAEHDALGPAACEALYVGGIASFDRWLGRLVDRLRERGLYDSTLIVLTSDHGEELGEREPRDAYDRHGHTLYEELVHVPLILKLPGGRFAGTRVREVVRGVDVAPTILDVAGVDGLPERQGETLRPTWESPGTGAPRLAFVEALATPREMKGVRTDRYKYTVTIPGDAVAAHGRSHWPETPPEGSLFDLVGDPGESVDLLGSAEPRGSAAEVAAVLHRALRDHVVSLSGRAEPVPLDQETLEELRALGYVK